MKTFLDKIKNKNIFDKINKKGIFNKINNKKIIIITVILIIFSLSSLFLINKVFNKEESNSKKINDKEGHTLLDSNKVLVIYFSHEDNMVTLAETLSDIVGGDIRRIKPTISYPSGEELTKRQLDERDTNARPLYEDLNIDINDYDYIFIGYPIWSYTMPMIIYTFLDNYDLSSKIIIPFNIHQGEGNGGTYATIASLASQAQVLKGLAINKEEEPLNYSALIKLWLEELNFL